MEPNTLQSSLQVRNSNLNPSESQASTSSYHPAISYIVLVSLGIFVFCFNEYMKSKKPLNHTVSKAPPSPPKQPVTMSPACSSSSSISSSNAIHIGYVKDRPSIDAVTSVNAISPELVDMFSETTQLWFNRIKDVFNNAAYCEKKLEDNTLFAYVEQIMSFYPYEPTRIHIRDIDRFSNVIPINKTRVLVDGCEFNGNFVFLLNEQRFIATQAPHKTPQSLGCLKEELFWNCLVKENVSGVFNLSNWHEGCRSYVAKTMVEPSRRAPKITDTALEESIESTGFSSNLHRVEIADRGSKEYTYVEVTQWEDAQGLPPKEIDALVSKQESLRANFPFDPILAHCRAGVGRTGVFMVACALKRIADLKLLTLENYTAVIITLVLSARAQRNRITVQSEAQMKSIAKYAHYLISKQIEIV